MRMQIRTRRKLHASISDMWAYSISGLGSHVRWQAGVEPAELAAFSTICASKSPSSSAVPLLMYRMSAGLLLPGALEAQYSMLYQHISACLLPT